MLYSTSPLGNIRMYTFGMIMLWKWPSFSLEKNKSGIHTLLASVRVRYFILPGQTMRPLVRCARFSARDGGGGGSGGANVWRGLFFPFCLFLRRIDGAEKTTTFLVTWDDTAFAYIVIEFRTFHRRERRDGFLRGRKEGRKEGRKKKKKADETVVNRRRRRRRRHHGSEWIKRDNDF